MIRQVRKVSSKCRPRWEASSRYGGILRFSFDGSHIRYETSGLIISQGGSRSATPDTRTYSFFCYPSYQRVSHT